MKNKIKIGLIILVFIGAIFFSYKTGIFVGEESVLKTPPPQITNTSSSAITSRVDFSLFWRVWHEIQTNFYRHKALDYQKMVYGAISGMVKSLDDPYTVFFNPQKTKEFNQSLAGQYEGVGMIVAIKKNNLQVIAPLKGTPAQKAGIRAGDKILRIGDTFTKDISLQEAVNLIKGPKNTSVNLLITRNSWTAPREFKIKRAVIHIPTTDLTFEDNKKIAVIKIYQFNGILLADFKKNVAKILKSPAKKIILDLRSNPGGYLEVSQKIAGYFLPKGETVVWQESVSGKKQEYKSPGPSIFKNYPIVCLIDKGTASAAEILAGSLRDQRGVKLIGETSFGKGSVQEELPLPDGSSLKITVAKWLTPKGTSIDKEGLTPDIPVKLTEEDIKANKDPQLDRALKVLEQKTP